MTSATATKPTLADEFESLLASWDESSTIYAVNARQFNELLAKLRAKEATSAREGKALARVRVKVRERIGFFEIRREHGATNLIKLLAAEAVDVLKEVEREIDAAKAKEKKGI